MNVTDLLKCPECLYEGMDLCVRYKTIEATCPSCNHLVTERIPYPKHRISSNGGIYPFRVGNVRPDFVDKDDEVTVSQEEYESQR